MRASVLRAYATRALALAGFAYALVVGWRLARYDGLLDFSAYYFGAQAALRRLPFYDRSVLAELARDSGFGGPVPAFVYPPPSLLLFLPLAPLPLEVARWIWVAGQLVSLGLALRLILDGLGARLPPRLAVSLLLLLPAPIYLTLMLGQISALMLLFLVAAWHAERRGRLGWAGVWLGLAILLRVVPALLLPYFVLRREYRAVASALGTVAAGLAIAELAFPGSMEEFVRGVLFGPDLPQWALWHNVSPAGLAQRLFASNRYAEPVVLLPHLRPILALASLVSVLAIGALGAASRRRDERGVDLAIALAVILSQLASPVTWSHSLLVLYLPLLIFWRSLRTPADWLLFGIAWLLLTGPWGYFATSDGGFGRLSELLGWDSQQATAALPPFWWTLLLASPLYGQIVALWLGWRLWRRGSSTSLADFAQPCHSAQVVVARQP